ncbi:hypothetical protein FPQ18DRAFT_401515 [Pyronema domesticum]|nr:hypothetical protein FPQ18DRAFT_401515 [Pyronema domesticum]
MAALIGFVRYGYVDFALPLPLVYPLSSVLWLFAVDGCSGPCVLCLCLFVSFKSFFPSSRQQLALPSWSQQSQQSAAAAAAAAAVPFAPPLPPRPSPLPPPPPPPPPLPGWVANSLCLLLPPQIRTRGVRQKEGSQQGLWWRLGK